MSVKIEPIVRAALALRPMTVTEMARYLAVDITIVNPYVLSPPVTYHSMARTFLSVLEKRGVVASDAEGRYRLVEKGHGR